MRDYAKKSQAPIKRKKYSNGSSLLILFLLCAIFFVGFTVYYFAHKKILAQKTVVLMPVKTPIQQKQFKKIKVVAIEQIQPIDNQPKYDFYKLLPKMTVVIPTDDQTTSAPPSLSYYLLQIASLESEVDAKALQNTLKNSGYSAFIQHYQGLDKLTWYRVMIGPIYNLKSAETQQTKLYAHQMIAMLLKVQK